MKKLNNPQKMAISTTFLCCFLMVLTFIFYLIDLTDYGPTWDEFFHVPTGEKYLRFIKTADMTEIILTPNSSWLPPVASTIGYLFVDNGYLKQIYPAQADRFHLAAIIYGSITVGMVFLITQFLFHNLYLSLFAGFLLLFHPQFITQAHTNVRDMGLTMFYSITIFCLLLSMKDKGNTFWTILSGFFAGLATDSKQNGFFLVFIACLFFLFHLKTLGFKRFILGFALFLSVFIFTFFLFWPYLWVDTLNHLQSAWGYLRDKSVLGGNLTFYDKVYFSMRNIPFYYPWIMLFLTTPPLVGFLAVVGLVASQKQIFSQQKREAILFLWIFIPLSRFLFPESSISHDQIRHFLEVLPVIPIFASFALWIIYKHFSHNKLLRSGIILIALIAVIYTRYISFIYHPYGTAYFNLFAGSPSYVTHAFDVEYWGNVYRKAVQDLNIAHGKYVTYYTPGLGSHLLLEDGLDGKLTENFYEDFNYVIFMNKQNWLREGRDYIQWLIKNKPPVYTIARGGKILFYQFRSYKDEYRRYLASR